MENLNLRLLCKKVKIDDRTRDYMLKRIQKMEKFLKKSLECEIEVSMDKKGEFAVEIMIQTSHKLYRATEISESIEGSADMAINELQRQIVADADRIRDLRRRGNRSIKKKMVLDENARF